MREEKKMKKILGLTLVFVMLVAALAVLPVAAEGDTDGYYAYLDQSITPVHKCKGEEYPITVDAKSVAANLDIPDEAKCIVIVWMEKEGNNFVYYAPVAITFVKDDAE